MTYAMKIVSFMEMEFFVFQVESFQFSKFHESVVKLYKGNFERDFQGQKFEKLLRKFV